MSLWTEPRGPDARLRAPLPGLAPGERLYSSSWQDLSLSLLDLSMSWMALNLAFPLPVAEASDTVAPMVTEAPPPHYQAEATRKFHL